MPDNRTMHLILPFASSVSEGCQAALAGLKLPYLQKLLARCTPLPPETGDEHTLTPPHERAVARALGLPVTDGLVPWAALRARERNLPQSDGAWAFVTLCHWQVNTNHMVVSHLPLPDLSVAESDALLAVMRPYFEEDGIALHPDQPGRWLAQGDGFANLACASPERVLCRNLDDWMPTQTAAAALRRLQNEMQMLLYTHPLHDARTGRGQVSANSFWISGTGSLPVRYTVPEASAQPTVMHTLRDAALAENWPAWTQAWHATDAQHIQPLLQAVNAGTAVHITLCGERSSQTWHTGPMSVHQKIKSFFGLQSLPKVLEVL